MSYSLIHTSPAQAFQAFSASHSRVFVWACAFWAKAKRATVKTTFATWGERMTSDA
jgi:hypothetical protein